MSELTIEKRMDIFLKGMQGFKEGMDKFKEGMQELRNQHLLIAEEHKLIAKEQNKLIDRQKEYEKRQEKEERRRKRMDQKWEGLGLSCGITAETFFIEGTEDGITIDKNNFKQDLSNYEVRKWIGKKLKTFTEIDLVLSTDDIVFLIETKYRIDEKHYDECEDRFALFQEHEQDYIAGRKIYKGIASLGVKKDMKAFYKEKGYFIFTQKGDNIKVFNPF